MNRPAKSTARACARRDDPKADRREGLQRALVPPQGIPDEGEADGVTMRLICSGGIVLTVTDPEIIALVLQIEKDRRRQAREATP